jgi:hypothetical protein
VGEGDGAADGVVGRSVLIETQQDLAVALERLRRRDPGALAAFIPSLAEVPAAEVAETVKGLMAVDSYGVRERLGAVDSTAGLDR